MALPVVKRVLGNSINGGPVTGYMTIPIAPLELVGLIQSPNVFAAKGSRNWQRLETVGGFTGGTAPVPQVTDVDIPSNAGLTPGTSTLTVGATVFTFVTAITGANQILIGVTEADTETNILNTLIVNLLTLNLTMAEIFANKVRITGPANGTALTITGSAGVSVTSITAAVAPTGATTTVKFTTLNNSPVAAAGVVQIRIPVFFNGIEDYVYFEYNVQPGDINTNILALNVATQLRKIFNAGTGNMTPGIAGVTLELQGTFTFLQIKAAVSAFYENVTVSGNALTFTANALQGSFSNGLELSLGIVYKEPGIPIDENGVPQIPCESIGLTTEPMVATADNALTEVYTEQLIGSVTTEAPQSTRNFTLTTINPNEIGISRLFQNAGQAGGAGQSVSPNSALAGGGVSLIFTQKDQRYPGYGVIFIRNAIITSQAFPMGKAKTANTFGITGVALDAFAGEIGGLRRITPRFPFVTGNE